MNEDAISKALDLIKKLEDEGIEDREKLDSIKSKIENGKGITLEEKDFLSENLEKLNNKKTEIISEVTNEKENNTKKPQRKIIFPKKIRNAGIGIAIAAITGIILLQIGIFDSLNLEFPDSLNVDSDFLVEGINPLQTYEVNNICEFADLVLTANLLYNIPPLEEWKTKFPQEYEIIKKYQGETEYEKQYFVSNLSQGRVADEVVDAISSVIMKSSSINPIFEPEIRAALDAAKAGTTDQWAFQFTERLRVEGKQCIQEGLEKLEKIKQELSHIVPKKAIVKSSGIASNGYYCVAYTLDNRSERFTVNDCTNEMGELILIEYDVGLGIAGKIIDDNPGKNSENNAEKVKIVGYDARDVRGVETHNGKILEQYFTQSYGKGDSLPDNYDSDDRIIADEVIAVYVKNEGAQPVEIAAVNYIVILNFNSEADFSLNINSQIHGFKFAVWKESSLPSTGQLIIEAGQTVTILLGGGGFDGAFESGESVPFGITTAEGNRISSEIIIGQKS